ncbi:protein translocase subunit SecF [Tsukamurella sp. 8F]|uniref:protein translocase subunit SecF n=1 Tax=unclassified Tsukamurella TaxID=2633480 RepID=UPI0023B9755B|nr:MULTISPECIES: protein translocase subunit SecF [unclassified Tsukamurella]MDF0529151.1 protein translocase subunit SecF [Tsukamurella sp. 8J]MDF0585336.1 protein translocase subunit SecF [Tsukamurella sp. 8F]
MTATATQAHHEGFLSKLYTGTGAFAIVGRRKVWYAATGIIVAVAIIGIIVRGFTLSIDFRGGTQVSFPVTGSADTAAVERIVTDATGTAPASVQTAGTGSTATYQIATSEMNNDDIAKVRTALFDRFHPEGRDGRPSAAAISFSDVSSTWGAQITRKAIIALIVFLVIVTAYIAVRFREWGMALAALASLFFDVIVTAGVYAWVGFQVSPATVIGLLTILGFSLYDTVVVFDKVEENVRGFQHTTRRTYAEQANLAVNQTLMRSINTTVISVLPIIALMVIAAWMLGVGTLNDLALIQLVGVVVGTYSSIFFATPLLVSFKERTEEVRRHTAKVMARRAREEGGGVGTASEPQEVPAKPAARPTTKRARRRG